MVKTSCSAIDMFSKRTRNTDPSNETTEAGRSMFDRRQRKSQAHFCGSSFPSASLRRMPAPPFDMSTVSPAIVLPSASLTTSGVMTLMRTVARRCINSRATAVQTPRITTLKQAPDDVHQHGAAAARIPDEEARNGNDEPGDVKEQASPGMAARCGNRKMCA